MRQTHQPMHYQGILRIGVMLLHALEAESPITSASNITRRLTDTREGYLCDESSWPDRDHGLVCGDCKVLVNNFMTKYKTCNGYCASLDLTCARAWEERDDTCAALFEMSCRTAFDTYDAICECSGIAVSTGQCSEQSWPDRGFVCGDCKVLVEEFASRYKTCTGYCAASGLECIRAWVNSEGTCAPKSEMSCDQTADSSNAICECRDTWASSGLVGAWWGEEGSILEIELAAAHEPRAYMEYYYVNLSTYALYSLHDLTKNSFRISHLRARLDTTVDLGSIAVWTPTNITFVNGAVFRKAKTLALVEPIQAGAIHVRVSNPNELVVGDRVVFCSGHHSEDRAVIGLNILQLDEALSFNYPVLGTTIVVIPSYHLENTATAVQLLPTAQLPSTTITSTTSYVETTTTTTTTITTTTTPPPTTTTATTAATTTTTTTMPTTTTTTAAIDLKTTTTPFPSLSFELPSVRQIDSSAAPDVFYTEYRIKIPVRINMSATPGATINDYEFFVRTQTAAFLGMGMAKVRCVVQHTGGEAQATIFLLITGRRSGSRYCPVAADPDPLMCFERRKDTFAELLRNSSSRDNLVVNNVHNRILSTNGNDVHFLTIVEKEICSSGICDLGEVAAKIVKNAGVFISYENYTIIAVIFVVMERTSWFIFRCKSNAKAGILNLQNENERGLFLKPLFCIGLTFLVLLLIWKEKNKYEYNTEVCEEARGNCLANSQGHDCVFYKTSCPASAFMLLLEICLVPVPTIIFGFYFYPKWGRRLADDAAREDQIGHTAVMPLQSAIERNKLLGAGVTYGAATVSDRCVFVAFYLFISFFVVLVSFFLLQRYEFPSKYIAWYPYKLLWELLAAKIVGSIVKHLMQKNMGFLYATTLILLCADIYFGVVIVEACNSQAGFEWEFKDTLRILDVAIAAGLLNFLLGPLSIKILLGLISVYFYEPQIRHKRLRCVHLESFEQWEDLCNALEQEHDEKTYASASGRANQDWTIKSVTVNGKQVPYEEAELASIDRPVCVHIEKKNLGLAWKLLLRVGDKVFSVQTESPVIPLSDSECGEEATEADAESSEGSYGLPQKVEKTCSAFCLS